MKTIVCALLAVTGVYAINLQIFTSTTCQGAQSFLFPFLPNVPDQCISNYASLALQSAILNCHGTTSGSSWTVHAWLTEPAAGLVGNYDCENPAAAVAVNGTGTACTQITITIPMVGTIPLGGAIVDCGAAEQTVVANGGNTAVEIGSNNPFELKIAQGSSVGSKYVSLEYVSITETTDAYGEGFTAESEGPNFVDGSYIFNYIPLNDASVQNAIVGSFVPSTSPNTATTQFGGYVGPASQNASNPSGSNVLVLDYVATADFTATKYDTAWTGLSGFAAVNNQVCLRGTGSTCSSWSVKKGQVKTAFGLYNWNLEESTSYFELGFDLETTGFTSPVAYFDYDTSKVCSQEPYDFTSITVTESGNNADNFTISIYQSVNNGDNTFSTGVITWSSYDSTTHVCTIYIDVPTDDFTTGPGHWWLYDPVVTNNVPAGSSDASIVSVSAAAIVAVVAAVVAAL